VAGNDAAEEITAIPQIAGNFDANTPWRLECLGTPKRVIWVSVVKEV